MLYCFRAWGRASFFVDQQRCCRILPLNLGRGITIERDLDRAMQQSDAVMMLRIQKERLTGVHIDHNEYVSRYQLNLERLSASGPRAIVMHPGPMIRGLEITSEVADGPQSVIEEQVRNGVAIRMALIHRALSPKTAAVAEPADKAHKRGAS